MIAVEVELTKARPCVLSSGIRGLDQLLGGGFIQGSSVLIDGPPGSGKSTVGLRLLHEGIMTHDEPGIMLAFEEFPRQVHQAALDAGIDLAAHERSGKLRILWTSPQRILEALQGGSDLLERVMVEMGARRLLVDSITHFRRVAASETSMREVLGTLIQQMKLRGVTTILVKELDLDNGGGVAFEEYLVDTSIRLHHAVAGIGCDQDARFLEVRKARGLANVGGLHPFELGPGGPLVHARWSPRLIDEAVGAVGAQQGPVMKYVMEKAAGSADGKVVSQLVAQRLKGG
jgi:circadian clock protein KaiC